MASTYSLPSKLRVIFTGHSGVNKRLVLERFAGHVKQRLEQLGEKRSVITAEVEQELGDMNSFLQLEHTVRQGQWMEAMNNAVQTCHKSDYAFLSLHLSYRHSSRFTSPVSWRGSRHGASASSLFDALNRRFKPDYYVCVIDDIQSAQSRIASGSSGIRLRLAELLAWRNIETLLTDTLCQATTLRNGTNREVAHFPLARSPVVSNRHPLEMLFRLLAQPACPRIYASFPITRTRYHAERREEIDDFRRALADRFCVFDPVTIDELPLTQFADPGKYKDNEAVRLPATARWPLDEATTLVGEPVLDTGALNPAEIREITRRAEGWDRTDLDFAVEERDRRLIDQADCVVVYRPQYSTGLEGDPKKHTPTAGTAAEMDYALKLVGRKVFVVHDSAVDGDLARGPLQHVLPAGPPYVIQEPNLADQASRARALGRLVQALEKHEPEIVRKRLGR